MEPIIFEPILKRIRWGGQKLGTILKKQTGPETDYAESWEIADHAAGQSRVATGTFAGRTLSELIKERGAEIFGSVDFPEQFPLLIKFLDANDWLSLQVHPNDAQAATFNPREHGKTEAWVIIDSAPDSQICMGLLDGVTRQDLRQALQAGTVVECLHRYHVEPGDCIFVPAGTVHAIGPGILLAEVQQQSDMTFRLFDWGRVGTDGNPRPVHIAESMSCIDFDRGPVAVVHPTLIESERGHVEQLVSCPYFDITRQTAEASFRIATEQQFRILIFLDGTATVVSEGGRINCIKGDTILIPASCQGVSVKPDESVTVLEVSGGSVG
jgi:mannose-6-phosphate isomerase